MTEKILRQNAKILKALIDRQKSASEIAVEQGINYYQVVNRLEDLHLMNKVEKITSGRGVYYKLTKEGKHDLRV